jgi:ATP-dependent helicase HepA
VNAEGLNVSGDFNPPPEELLPGAVFQLLDNHRIKQKLLPGMLEKSREHATERAAAICRHAIEKMRAMLRSESDRLRDLQKVNDHIRDEEISLLETQTKDLALHLESAPLRLDSVRLILRSPTGSS